MRRSFSPNALPGPRGRRGATRAFSILLHTPDAFRLDELLGSRAGRRRLLTFPLGFGPLAQPDPDVAPSSADFDLVNRVFLRLEARIASAGLGVLNADERAVYWIWAALGLIGNGGFKYYLENGLDLEPAAEAFAHIGLTAGADACRQVGQIVARCARRSEWRVLSHHLEEFEPTIAPLNTVIFQLESEATQRLAQHIRLNRLE
jgi:hypothetical protein